MKQPQLCYTCHLEVQQNFNRAFHHRVNEGLVRCTDCHNPHGGFLNRQLRATSSQDAVCFKCHVEKEGPFVHEHPPVKTEGCTSCHVIYANDRSRVNSGPYAKYGNRGYSFSKDPSIPKQESGHPIDHAFAKGNGIPSSQCMVCHMHPGTTVMNSYMGMMWWDEETDGEHIYPEKQKYPTAEQYIGAHILNPNG